MQNMILTIVGVPVFVSELPSGDLKVWHPFNKQVRSLVEPMCRGRGRWHPGYTNWVIFSKFKYEIVADLRALAEVERG
ncbi:MAG TPA: hypothetical protein PLS93_18265 [Accumulibacter sp.]|nr:hypothetical protein [Accumulibacter sp.]